MSSPHDAESATLILTSVPLPLLPTGPPAPELVLAVEDQHVRAARRDDLRVRDPRARRLLAGLQDRRGGPLVEVDPPDGLVGGVEDVRRAVVAADEARQLDRRRRPGTRTRRVDRTGTTPYRRVEARQSPPRGARRPRRSGSPPLSASSSFAKARVRQLERLAPDRPRSGPCPGPLTRSDGLLGLLEASWAAVSDSIGARGLLLAADGVDAEHERRRRRR